MSRIGVAVGGNKVQDIQATIQRAEELGVDAIWMTTGGARLDSITVFAAAAASTQRIKFGTSIVPTFPRHPLVVAQQVQVVAQLARPLPIGLGAQPSANHAGHGHPDAESPGPSSGVSAHR